MSPEGAEAPGALRVIAPLLLFLLALGVRALPVTTVLHGGRVYLFGADSFYHLRRILYSLTHFPDVLLFDRYINFPHGAKPIWTPVFDWLSALSLLPLARGGDLRAAERAAVWIPALLGAACVLALYALAKRLFGWRVALLAGVLLSVSSAHFWYSQLGFVDHHAAVALASTLLLAAALSLRMRFDRDPAAWAPSLWTGAALAAVLALWPGALLHVALVEAALALELLALRDRGAAVALARRLAAAQALALLLLLPAGWSAEWPQWGRFSPVVLSRFQPWLFASAALWAAGCAALWARSGAGRSRRARAATAALLGLALLGASVAWLPGLAEGPGDAWRWLGRRESFQAAVAESQPLLLERGRLDFRAARERLSDFVFLLPLALAALLARARGTGGAPLRMLALWSAGLFAVTLLQRRFFNSFSVCLALLMAWGARELYRALPAAARATRARRGLACTGIGLLAVGMLAPSAATYAQHLANLRRDPGARVAVSPAFARRTAAVDMALWILRETPPTSGWLDADAEPEYGVLAPWGVGHVIEYVAQRPTVTDNFGDDIGEENFELARRYYVSSEPEAVALLERLRVRYVVSQSRRAFLDAEPGEDSMQWALDRRDGMGSVPDGRHEPRSGLAHHRLVFESQPLGRGGPELPSLYKVFEYVPGAVIRGRAAPGATLRAQVAVTTNRRRELSWHTSARADGAGRYALRVPYANRGGPHTVRVAPHYWISCGDARAPLRVDDADVLGGREIAGPDLCAAGAARAGAAAVR